MNFSVVAKSVGEKAFFIRSSDERNMTRKTRSQRIHTAFQSGYCAVCHIHYTNLEEHLQSKSHNKLTEDDDDIISLKSFHSLLALDAIDALDGKNFSKMPRTRTSSVMCDRLKTPTSLLENESGHRLRSRKNINYMTPPLEDDSLTDKPEVVREYRELRSSTRLLAVI